MQKPPIEARKYSQEYDNEIYKNEDVTRGSLSRLYHGDLYVIGRLWIQALRAVLVGANLNLSFIPVVHATNANKPKEGAPEKPPPMKYKDLPIYQSPHYEYKDYIEDQKKCPKANVKILHHYLYPKVKTYRKSWADSYAELKKDVGEMKSDACAALCKKKKEFKRYMRAPENLVIRQAVVVIGTAAGYYFGSGRGIPRRLFFTSIGALSAGALCFPKETDEIFRNFSYRVGKFALSMYNTTCGKNICLRERLPCHDELPQTPPPRPPHQVNKCDIHKGGAAAAAAPPPPPPTPPAPEVKPAKK